MTRLPPLKAREVARGLIALGFEKVRQKGSQPYSITRTAAARLCQFTLRRKSALIFFPIFSSSLIFQRMSSF
jgi:hypothetical protein